VRIILASNQPLEALVADGRFRQDLYYRINVVTIELAPLRERTADIPILARYFLDMYGAELGKQLTGFSPEAMDALRRYRFPGNIRELQNVIERAAVLCRRPTVGVEDLPPQVISGGNAPARPGPADTTGASWEPIPLEQALLAPERQILLAALRANHWNRQRTSEQLGINRTTLYKKMKLHNIDAHDAA
jgi:DNA-binding NtrC family response regulator